LDQLFSFKFIWNKVDITEIESTTTTKQTEQWASEVAQVTSGAQFNTTVGVAVIASDKDGRFISLENRSEKDQNLGGWQVKRKINGAKDISVTLPKSVSLPAKHSVKVWAKNYDGSNENDIVLRDIDSWGVGQKVDTFLYPKDSNGRVSEGHCAVYHFTSA